MWKGFVNWILAAISIYCICANYLLFIFLGPEESLSQDTMGSFLSKIFSFWSSADDRQPSSKILTNEKCRNCRYPKSEVQRTNVPNEYLKWETDFPNYDPISYTSDSIKGQPWADPEYVWCDSVAFIFIS